MAATTGSQVINLADKVAERMNAAAAARAESPAAETPPEAAPPASETPAPPPPAPDRPGPTAADLSASSSSASLAPNLDDVLELNVRGKKRTEKLGEIVKDRTRLQRALQRDEAYEELLGEFDAKKRTEAERMAGNWLVAQGLAHVDPMTGAIVPNDDARRPAVPAPREAPAPAAPPASPEFDLEAAMTPEERRSLDSLYAANTQEAWYKAESLKTRIILRAAEERVMRRVQPEVRAVQTELEAGKTAASVAQFVQKTNALIDHHSAVFQTEADKVFAREAVASAVERGVPPFEAMREVERVAGYIRSRDDRLRSTPSPVPAPRAATPPGRTAGAPPRPVGHGSGHGSLPPGPPSRGQPGAEQPFKPRLGSAEFQEQVRLRLAGN